MLRPAVLLVALAAALGGCLQASYDAGASPEYDPDGARACADDADCTLAGSSCCDCPSFAVPVASGWEMSCEDVDCPSVPGGTCSALAARCDRGACVAACAPVACDVVCADGFAVDGFGCQVCACAGGPALATCEVDSDCARVPADCCGCARGGADTAVLTAAVGAHLAGLMCPAAPSCPEVSTCAPDAEVRCVAGACALVRPSDAPPPSVPATACGRPELPPCPDGQRCVLNLVPAASQQGLGACAP
ncbi:MAG TPA: hypothetical protein VM734_12870 [Kofleriaceae bacterium]|jgi:hypothetical protein|nr:hypothetical protein [Kofleriaceae bacterium]